MAKRNEALQAQCRAYLTKLQYLAKKHGLGGWVTDIILANKRKECEGTQHEVEMLARAVDEERIARTDIPQMLGKSYRQCVDDDDFSKVKKLKRVGDYSKLSALLYKQKLKNNK